MQLSAIAEATRNVKAHATTDIRRSVAKFGYVDPVVLDERTGRLVAGHGRLEALRAAEAAGEGAPEGVEVSPEGEWLVPVLRGWASRSDDEAEAYLVAANRLSEKGGWDDYGLAEVLSDLADAQLLELAGYSTEELDDLIASVQETAPLPVGGFDDDEDDPLEGQQRTTPGMTERRDDYENSNQRVLVLSYPGDTYVWMVGKLASVSQKLGVDTNSDAVLRLVEQFVGETAPAADAAEGDGGDD